MNTKAVTKLFNILIISISTYCLIGCSSEAPHYENVSAEPVEISEDYESVADNTADMITSSKLPKDLKIIKSANVKYKVKNVKIATSTIKEFAYKYDAYVSDLRFENNSHTLENRFTIKIPQQYFDTMIDSINTVAQYIDYENITTDDVTEEYVDLETRLKTKLEVKQRYETILRKNAKTVEDILATEEKLRIIQEEIEAAQGKLKYLTSKVAYSTIQIDLYETVDHKDKPETYAQTFWSKSKNGFSFGWDLIQQIAIGIIYIWPLLFIGFIILVILRKRKVKKTSA